MTTKFCGIAFSCQNHAAHRVFELEKQNHLLYTKPTLLDATTREASGAVLDILTRGDASRKLKTQFPVKRPIQNKKILLSRLTNLAGNGLSLSSARAPPQRVSVDKFSLRLFLLQEFAQRPPSLLRLGSTLAVVQAAPKHEPYDSGLDRLSSHFLSKSPGYPSGKTHTNIDRVHLFGLLSSAIALGVKRFFWSLHSTVCTYGVDGHNPSNGETWKGIRVRRQEKWTLE